MKKIAFYESWFFLQFDVFHLHRIWGMLDRNSYSDFWIGIGVYDETRMDFVSCLW